MELQSDRTLASASADKDGDGQYVVAFSIDQHKDERFLLLWYHSCQRAANIEQSSGANPPCPAEPQLDFAQLLLLVDHCYSGMAFRELIEYRLVEYIVPLYGDS